MFSWKRNLWLVALLTAALVAVTPVSASAALQEQETPQEQEELERLRKRVEELEKAMEGLQAATKELEAATKELEQLRKRVAELEAEKEEAKEKVDILKKVLVDGISPGFFHVPGTKSQLKFGGYVRMDAISDFDLLTQQLGPGLYTPAVITSGSPGANLDGNTFFSMAATRLNLDFRTPDPDHETWLGDLRVFFEVDFWPNNFRIRHAYGQWGPLLVGQTWETWYDIEAAPIAYDYAGPPGGDPLRVPMIRWAQPLGAGFSLTGAIESPDSEITIPTDDDGTPVAQTQNRWPDFVFVFEKRQKEGRAWHLRVSGLFRDLRTQGESPGANASTLGWGFYFTGRIPTFIGDDTLGFGVDAGEGISHYLNALSGVGADAYLTPTGLEKPPVFGVFGSYERRWAKTVFSSFTYGYLHSDNLDVQAADAIRSSNYAVANVMWHVTPLVEFGLEYIYLDRTDKDGSFGVANRLNFVFIYSFTPDHPYPRKLFN